jgi:hypothetical protein
MKNKCEFCKNQVSNNSDFQKLCIMEYRIIELGEFMGYRLFVENQRGGFTEADANMIRAEFVKYIKWLMEGRIEANKTDFERDFEKRFGKILG